MALIVKDRVCESSTTTGTGAFALAGAYTGYRAFSAVCATSDTCYYLIEAIDASGNATGEWETGYGTYSAASTLTRTAVKDSSTGSAVVFSAGTKRVSISATQAYQAINGGWTQVSFGTSITAYGSTVFPSVETFTMSATSRLEIEATLYRGTSTTASLIVGVDGTNAYNWAAQGDANYIIYRQNGATQTVLGTITGQDGSHSYAATHKITAVLVMAAASNNYIYGLFDDLRYPNSTTNLNNTTFTLVGANTLWVITDDITKCFVRARII